MKISWLIDKEADQNEVESKYLWYLKENITIRINLSTFTVDFSQPLEDNTQIAYRMAIPNNRVYGIKKKQNSKYLFILDEIFNSTKIETFIDPSLQRNSISCFYDDSIFFFEHCRDWRSTEIWRAKRYIISQNKWAYLSGLPSIAPFCSCTGISQKIIIAVNKSGWFSIWIYDIILDSYSRHFPFQKWFQVMPNQIFIKSQCKIYLILFSNEIYACDDPLSEWKLVLKYDGIKIGDEFRMRAYYEGSIYYLRNSIIYKFDLSKSTPIAVGNLSKHLINKKIKRI